jgi:hypothetical protein
VPRRSCLSVPHPHYSSEGNISKIGLLPERKGTLSLKLTLETLPVFCMTFLRGANGFLVAGVPRGRCVGVCHAITALRETPLTNGTPEGKGSTLSVAYFRSTPIFAWYFLGAQTAFQACLEEAVWVPAMS